MILVIFLIIFNISNAIDIDNNKKMFHNSFKNILLNKLGIDDENIKNDAIIDSSINDSYSRLEAYKKDHSSFLLQLEIQNIYENFKNDDKLYKLFDKFNQPYNIIRSFFGEYIIFYQI
jgi:hypothetical protein